MLPVHIRLASAVAYGILPDGGLCEGIENITAEDIPPEVRLLTILDIFDALTARDRPYKPGMPAEKAFGIMHNMVEEGNIDGDILALFEGSDAWEEVK